MHRIAITALVVALSACGGDIQIEPEPVPTVDAGSDAGTDAGVDAGSDAGTDAGSDAEEEPEPTGPLGIVIANDTDETVFIYGIAILDRDSGEWVVPLMDPDLPPRSETDFGAIIPRACSVGSAWIGTLGVKIAVPHYSGDEWPVPGGRIQGSGAEWVSAPGNHFAVPCPRVGMHITFTRDDHGEPLAIFATH